MRRSRNVLFYIGTISVFTLLMLWIINTGKALELEKDVLVSNTAVNHWQLFKKTFLESLQHPLALLLIQIITIIIAARLLSWFCRKIGQPSVIGEIIAGIILGPSLLGAYFPGFYHALFPVASLGNLQLISQIGLILFMFVIGMELDLNGTKNKVHEAVVVSHASIIIPFALGMGLAYFIYSSFAPRGISFTSFGLFMGISMSITAFPVLARIVQEKGIYKTSLGTIVITCAAIDDITAWSLLAVVIAIVKADSLISSLPTIIMAVAYVFIMLKLIKPFLKRVGDLHSSRENLSKSIVAIFFLVLVLSSYATEIIGIHALFGAFMAGIIMPDNPRFKQLFIEKVEDVALVLLLPLFFVYTGLRTQIGLLNDAHAWIVCVLTILVAITGKFAGSALAAKFVGRNWHDSLTIGVLMNTRGLVELVALNIGYDMGVLTPEIFAILVIMALVTTFMTAPALNLIERVFRKEPEAESKLIQMSKFDVLISFGRPEMGRILLRLVHRLVMNAHNNTRITALHLFPGNLFNKYKLDDYKKESFVPIDMESRKLKYDITPIFKVTEDIDADISEEANKGDYDLLMIGLGHSIYEGSILGKLIGQTSRILNPDRLLGKFGDKGKPTRQYPFDERTLHILKRTKIPVGILINNGLHNTDKILLLYLDAQDAFLLEYADKFVKNSGVHITILDVEGSIQSGEAIKNLIQPIELSVPNYISLISGKAFDDKQIQKHDLMLVSLNGWKKINESKINWTEHPASVLIIRQ